MAHQPEVRMTDIPTTAGVGPLIDLVIPVYGQSALVSRCIESVLAFRGRSLGTVWIIDDASPDEATRDYLDALDRRGDVHLLRHTINRGFVSSVNDGILASPRDVVLLNSDTEVHGDWIERLARCAYSHPDIGTVTPFSNHATICSYPFPAWRRSLPSGISLAQMDRWFAGLNDGDMTDLPTGVGFCLFIRRACLDTVGLFDVDRFGRGYGEENDFCQRARLAGWRNVLAADTFVYHEVGGTFGAERRARARAAERVLQSLYPDYARRVREFIAADTAARFRERVDAARASLSLRQAASVAAERVRCRVWRVAFSLQPRIY
jgi:GT2 family glycosyltransferase